MNMIRQGFTAAGAALLLMTTAFALGANAQETTKAAPQERPSALSETYQDWVVSCQQGAGANGTTTRACQMSQELRQNETNQRVLLISIEATIEDAEPRAMIIAPFGLKLSQGLGLVVDEEDLAQVPFDTCFPAGCVAYLDLDMAMLDVLRDGEAAQIIVQPRQSEEPLLITVSLAGFTTAWYRLDSLK